ncbi:MAG: SycD/LcrH family type III secretion system chaperone [Parachlamydiaceae bacterium]
MDKRKWVSISMEDSIGDFQLSKKAKNKLKNKTRLQKELALGKIPQEILEIPEDTMLKFYKAACHLFENRHYADAADAFLFLVSLNAHSHDYWIGLGMASQMCGDFEMAIDAYEIAAVYQIENPLPYFYLAKCLFAMHEKQSALQALEVAIEYAGNIPQYQELKAQAVTALESLKKQT